MASIEDKITRVMDGVTYPNVARVVSPRAAGSDILMADGLSGWSTETAMNFITYRADSAGNVIEGTVRDWIGVANKANSSIINLKLLAGPEDDGSNVGDIVQPCASASYADRLAQALLESLDTDGKLKEGIVEDKNIAKESITAESIKDGGITSDKINLATLNKLGFSSVTVRPDTSNYYNSGSNRVRLKKVIKQHGNITVDTENNEFIVGKDISEVEVYASVMAEGLSTYLYLLAQIKRKGSREYERLEQTLIGPSSGYGGVSLFASINVSEGDRVSVLHDCTGTIRGNYSVVKVKSA